MISERTLELILNDAFIELDLSLPLTKEDVSDIINYFWNLQCFLVDSLCLYDDEVTEEDLTELTDAIDELSHDLDLDYLNELLNKM